MLSPGEQRKASQFRFTRDRKRYVLAHGYCRMILSHYLQIAANQIRLAADVDGKPYITDQVNVVQPIQFNLTHAGDYAYVAVSVHPVGIDIEPIDPGLPFDELAQVVMSHEEQRRFAELPDADKPMAFACLWTRKEAYVKALGKGLSYPIKQLSVSFDPVLTAPWSDTHDPVERERWRMFALEMPERYVGAVVGQGKQLVYREIV